jgi:triphosphatase
MSDERTEKTGSARAPALPVEPAPPIIRAGAVALTGDMPAGAAAAMVLRACHAHWLGNEAAVRMRDAEGVHQMRVALRRLRAALALFRAMAPPARLKSLDADVKWLAGRLGAARDWDVFLETTLAPLMEERRGEPGLMEIRQMVGELRGTAYDELLAALGSGRYTALASELAMLAGDIQASGSAAELAIRDLMQHALDRRYTKILRRGRRLEKLNPEQRHQLRIQLKKLRYCTDFSRAIFPRKRRRRFSRELGALQDLFGALNDAATAERLVRSLAADNAGEAQSEAARAGGLIIGWHAAQSRHGRAGLAGQWRRLVEAKPFWR